MAALAGTSTTRKILAELVEPYGWYRAEHVQRIVEWAAELAQKARYDSAEVRIEPYTLYLTAPNAADRGNQDSRLGFAG